MKTQGTRGFIYLLGCATPTEEGYLYKIGRTKNLLKRMDQYAKLPIQIDILSYYETWNMFIEERMWHDKYSFLRRRGEWFDFASYQLMEFSLRCLDVYKDCMTNESYRKHRIGIIYFPAYRDQCIWSPNLLTR